MNVDQATPRVRVFITRFSDSQFLHIGTYLLETRENQTKCFWWTGNRWVSWKRSWVQESERRGDDHFAETEFSEIQKLLPGVAAATVPWDDAPR